MASILERIKKRRSYPVQIGDETIHLRSLTLGELERLENLEPSARTGFVLACSLVRDDGQPEFTAATDESDTQLADRVLDSLTDVPDDNLQAIAAAVTKLRHTPPVETIAKN